MQPIEQALNEVRSLHEQLNKVPAPEIGPHEFLPMPAGHDPVAFALEEVERLKKILDASKAAPQQTPGATPTQWVPRASVFAGDFTLSFAVEVPGVAKEDVSVTVSSGELIVRGQREPVSPEGGLQPVMVEQSWGAFERRFPLPGWAGSEHVSARYELGVLEITVARNAEEVRGEFRVEIG